MKRISKALFVLAVASMILNGCGTKESPETGIQKSEEISETSTVVSEAVSDEADAAEETEEVTEPVTVEAVPLRDGIKDKLGIFAGCATTLDEMKDDKVWEIITTHFERVTFGNELKPDALVGYSCTICPGKETVVFNGEEMEVPKLDYSRAEAMLDKIYDWNQENPDREIKVRGHVLVWHSQTPEWFFHENYDKTKPYVDKETMNKRLEWYIMTVLTHFTGEDSKYKGMFYGWDVVNEAVSDGAGGVDGLRTDSENPGESLNEDRHGSNSSWYHIYQSNEFIINAFKYANKYAPADLELYYNDYNETGVQKRTNIINLLEAIIAEEGEPGTGTRIDAMGMQGHYGMDNPSNSEIELSIKMYSRVVGKVQITEMDVSASSEYDGSEAAVEEENERLRKRYNMISFAIKTAMSNNGIQFDGITFWGTVDHYSWLQSRSNIGGGNKTGLPQMPLLFDQNYEPKPCFFVFSDKK